jgi:1,4-dihydroxy-2-naphthoate polyprenyltransferase
MNPWIAAARPKTLVAGIIPVALGSALAAEKNDFRLGVFVAALGGALAIQVGTNYVNDAADFERGADTEERLGPPRMAAQGLLTPKALYKGAGVAFFLAFLFGIYLIALAGMPILAIGLVSILFAIAYTAGPFPLAYLGLGDIFVLIFFGLVAVLGTFYAHALEIKRDAVYLAFATGIQGMALIAVNNLRDIPTDIKAGKKTLSVRLGDKGSRWYYCALLFLPYFFWVPFAARLPLYSAFLPFLSFPLAVMNMNLGFGITDRREFNGLLAKTAALQLIFGALACLSLVLPK